MKNILVISGHPELTIPSPMPLFLMKWRPPFLMLSSSSGQALSGWQIQHRGGAGSLLRADVIVWQFPFSWYGLPD